LNQPVLSIECLLLNETTRVFDITMKLGEPLCN